MPPRDETYDFGLAPGERFEPDEEDEAPFDLANPHVMTALGPIAPEDLGFTLHRAHVDRRPLGAGTADPDPLLDDPARPLAELEAAYNVGLRAVVDVTTTDDGRDIADVSWIAQRAPVHLILVTGHRDDAPIASDESIDQIVARIVRELTDGIDGTPSGPDSSWRERV